MKTHPDLPKGKEQVTPIIAISPHLASPEGEGQIHLTAWLSMTYQIRSNLHLPVFDRTGVTCISPTGENERGLMFRYRVTSSFPWGRLGWVILGEEREGADVHWLKSLAE